MKHNNSNLFFADMLRLLRSFLFLAFILNVLLSTCLTASQSYSPKCKDPISDAIFWTPYSEIDNYEFNCMAEDNDGVIWFGCRGAIVRYDKDDWTYYTQLENMGEDRVLSICTDNDNNVFAGSESGLYKYADGKWENLISSNIPDKIQINEIKQFRDGSIWAASNKGIFHINDKKLLLFTSEQFASQLENDFKDIEIQTFNLKLDSEFNIKTICQGTGDEVWFAIESGEIVRTRQNSFLKDLDKWRVIDKSKGIEINMPQKLLLANDGRIWSITSQANTGIHIYNPILGEWTATYLSHLFGGDDINVSIIQTRDNKIWVGGHGKLFTFLKGQWKQYTNYETSLPAARIELLETRSGDVWVGGKHNEVFRLDYSQKRLEIIFGLNFHCESPDGKRWYISADGRVVSYNPKNKSWISFGPEDGLIDIPLTLLEDSKGNVWAAGSHKSTAATAYFKNNSWVKQLHSELGSCIHYSSAFLSEDGSLWFGAYDSFLKNNFLGGVIKIELTENGELRKTLYPADEIGKINNVGITQTKDGTIWTGGPFTATYDGSKWNKLPDTTELSTGWIDDIKCDQSGGLWVAKEGVGLLYLPYESKDWKKFTALEGLANNTVLNILPLNDNTVFAGTKKGISRFDGKSWTKYAMPTSLFLSRDEGFLSQTKNGSIMINFSARSWNRRAFEPITAREKNYIDKNFRVVSYFPERIPPKTKIILAPYNVSDEGNIFIQWEGTDYLNHTPGNRIQYSYKLDNQPWSQYTYDKQKLYLSVERGAHIFKVRARDYDFNVEFMPQQHIFIVSPPMWMRPWFITLVVILTAVIVLLIIYLHKKQLRLNSIEAEKLHEMDMMKLRFYTNLSHDLRTPLNLILGPLSDLIEKIKSNGDSKLKRQYELMHRNALRLNKLVNEIIDFRRIEAGSIEYSPSSGYIKKFIENIVDSFKLLSLKQKIKLTLNADFEDRYVLFDSNKLETILYNLLSNAFKFTPSNGQIILNLNIVSLGSEEMLEMRLEDSGQGIPEEKIDTIFERFIQLDTVKYGSENGSGIGLALTKELVQVCGGRISANNRTDGGAVFTVTLPLKISHSKEAIEIKKLFSKELEYNETEGDNNSNKNKTMYVVLVVEDFDDEREYLVEKLIDTYDVVSAKDGEEGFTKAKEIIPDLIISDIKMPNVDGFEFCKKVREDEVTSHIPFIFITGSRSEEIELESLSIGADDYISKPFRYPLLLARIQNLFKSRQKLKERFSESFQIDPAQFSSKDNDFFEKVKEIVNNHLADESFDILKLCHEVGMSRTQIFRKFKALTGITPTTYIRNTRLQKAAFLLKNTDMNVTEICYEVGYKYPGHFSQHFKNFYNLSPKEYQKKK